MMAENAVAMKASAAVAATKTPPASTLETATAETAIVTKLRPEATTAAQSSEAVAHEIDPVIAQRMLNSKLEDPSAHNPPASDE